MLQSMGSQRVGHDIATELNTREAHIYCLEHTESEPYPQMTTQ